MNHSVLFRESPLDQFEAVVAAISRVYGIPTYDAGMRVRRGWGFLERNLSPEKAQEIRNALVAEGIAALDLPNAELIEPPVPEIMTGFRAEADGFIPQLQSPKSEPHRIGWSEVGLVAAGGFSEELVRREASNGGKTGKAQLIGIGVFLMTGIPMGLFRGKKKEDKPVKTNRLITFAQLITTRGESFFMDPERFDFSGLGPQKQVNASLNFRTFISEFARLTPARLNLGARYILDNKAVTAANYHSLKDFDTELLWMVNTAAAR